MDSELLKGTLSLLILSLLSRKPMYGYEIAATVHHTDGATWRDRSTSLHKLEAGGLKGSGKKRDRRKQRYYQVTKKGRRPSGKIGIVGELCRAVNRVLESSDGQA